MTHIEQALRVRHLLKHAWNPFFARFGRLTPIQLQSIPKVLDGTNIVVASPTASGKTEAVVAPLAERFVSECQTDFAVAYVVPTRALANDCFDRISGPLKDMGIRCDIKHGDKPTLSGRAFPNFVITTPESLDSLICRRSSDLVSLRAVVLDEIHLLDNTYRGDQLRILIRRMQGISNKGPLAVHLLSATLKDPAAVASRYVADFEIVKSGVSRTIEYC